MAAITSSRTEKLRAWRQEKGRTPMKRLSYVVECAARPQTPAATPTSLGLGSKHTKQPMASLRAPVTPHPVKKGPSYTENRPPKSRERPRPHTAQRGRSLAKFELAQTRRKMLEEWRAKNRRTLKRPPLFLKPANRNEKPARAMKRRHTIGGFGGGGGGFGGGGGGGGEKGRVVGLRPGGKTERDILKERLQREIAEDFAVDMEEGEGEREAGGEVEPHTLTSESKDEKKERETNPDNCVGFKSRRVRFMLSEPRRRRSCFASLTPGPTPRTVYLTPVRRSTREGRNCDGPGMKLDAECCFDSPSEVSKQLDFDDLHIVTNNVLQ